MDTDQILRKILVDKKLKEYWKEIIKVDSENIKTINVRNNIYLKYLYTVLSDNYANDNVRKNSVVNLID